jgi:hypothetical protein
VADPPEGKAAVLGGGSRARAGGVRGAEGVSMIGSVEVTSGSEQRPFSVSEEELSLVVEISGVSLCG